MEKLDNYSALAPQAQWVREARDKCDRMKTTMQWVMAGAVLLAFAVGILAGRCF